MVSRPWRIKARRGWGEAEKFAHTALMASRSCKGRASKALGDLCQHYAHISHMAITDLLELEICPLIGHPFVPGAKFALRGSRGRMDVF